MRRARWVVLASAVAMLGWGTVLPYQYAYAAQTRGWGGLVAALSASVFSVGALVVARLALPVYAAVPFIPDRNLAVSVLLAAALVHYGLNAVAACSWNSWIKDLIPAETLGCFAGRRTVVGTAVSAASGKASG